MSVQSALRFVQLARSDLALSVKLRALGSDEVLEAVVQLGADLDLAFTVDELRAAFKYDWAMRWARYGGLKQATGEQGAKN